MALKALDAGSADHRAQDDAWNEVRHCGFANSHEGGYLILGAGRAGTEWSAGGLRFADDEPQTWIGQVVRAGIRPVPHFGVRWWPTEDGRAVAVVAVDPVASPPAICRGTV